MLTTLPVPRNMDRSGERPGSGAEGRVAGKLTLTLPMHPPVEPTWRGEGQGSGWVSWKVARWAGGEGRAGSGVSGIGWDQVGED